MLAKVLKLVLARRSSCCIGGLVAVGAFLFHFVIDVYCLNRLPNAESVSVDVEEDSMIVPVTFLSNLLTLSARCVLTLGKTR